jgi:hypothetical protein
VPYPFGMPSNAVPGFLPSRCGFRFANRWPPGPTIRLGRIDPRLIGLGNASAGLCGGMALTARDLFEAGILPPADMAPPKNGSTRFRAIVRRQVESLDWLRVPLRYYDLQAFRPDPPTAWSRILGRTPARLVALRDEWPRIRADIDAGRLPVTGLVRASGPSPMDLMRSHQVLAWAYDETPERIVVRVYDPNHPGRDDVELRIHREDELIRLEQSTGEPLHGLFRQPYPLPRSVRAWR